MIENILRLYENRQITLPSWTRGYSKEQSNAYRDREKQEWLAGRLIEYFNHKKIVWTRTKNAAFTGEGEFKFLLLKLPSLADSRYRGSLTFNYELTIFKDNKEIFTLENFCDEGIYDSMSYSIPVMDLFNIATTGGKSKPKTAHICGMQGYNPRFGDKCPACEAFS
ncbi:MAG: hypothetical protein Q8P07_02780 [bacterium]|nr:hypothetical protein [bacterium]